MGRVETNFKNMHPSLATLTLKWACVFDPGSICAVDKYIFERIIHREWMDDARSEATRRLLFSSSRKRINLFILNFPLLHIIHHHPSLIYSAQ